MCDPLVPMNFVRPRAARVQMCLFRSKGWDGSNSRVAVSPKRTLPSLRLLLCSLFPVTLSFCSVPTFAGVKVLPQRSRALNTQADVDSREKPHGNECCLARLSSGRLYGRYVICSHDAGGRDPGTGHIPELCMLRMCEPSPGCDWKAARMGEKRLQPRLPEAPPGNKAPLEGSAWRVTAAPGPR